MDKWLAQALGYIPEWLDFQMRESQQPGCVVAIAHQGRVVLERAFGHADAVSGEALTPRHRFRVASHSKSFTAATVLRLRERGRLKLDDRAGDHVEGLHPNIAKATISQLLSHSAGLTRDGDDTGQWQDRRPFLDEAELRAALKAPPVIEANTRFKYSNHGYGLLGLIVAAAAGKPYVVAVKEEIAPAGLADTTPDMPVAPGTPLARGHSGRHPLGRRVVIPGENPTNALAAATGFVSTARDLVKFFNQLSPNASRGVLSPDSRREMIRRQWRDPHNTVERYYGLGIMSGRIGEWNWFGHAGGFQGFITRTVTLPDHDLSVSVLTNAADGPSHIWLEGIVRQLQLVRKHGPASRSTRGWTGRWWSLWGAIDLVPMGDKVMVGAPALWNPFQDASELDVTGKDSARIGLAPGTGSQGQEVRRVRGSDGTVDEVWFAGSKLLPEAKAAEELRQRYEGKAKAKRRRASPPA